MTLLPVIDRELRTQARLGFTYYSRVLGAGASLLACLVYGAEHGFSSHIGGELFAYLHLTLLVTIWILVPLLTADCISRERREGTLGLLFLTPLREREVVMAKGMVHGTRALALLLAVLPIMTISFLIGGVSWKEALMSAFINFSSVCWALAAGLLASSLSKTWARALLLAAVLAGLFLGGFVILNGGAIFVSFPNLRGGNSSFGMPLMEIPFVGAQAVGDINHCWGQVFSMLGWRYQEAWLLAEAVVTLFSLFGLLCAILMAARNLRRNWQDKPPSQRQVWAEAKFCRPVVATGFFKRWMRRKLEKNPIGWLAQRTWSGRLVMWGWLGVMVVFYSAISFFPNVLGAMSEVQDAMAWSLLCIMGGTAAASFQRERENRVLELLLVSPMSAADLMWGRLRGLWGQFIPSLALMLFVWGYLDILFRWSGESSFVPYFCSSLLTIPIIGLYYSLKRLAFMNAFLSTLIVGLLLPYLVRYILAMLAWTVVGSGYMNDDFFNSSVILIVVQISMAVSLGGRLIRNLAERNFPFTRGAG